MKYDPFMLNEVKEDLSEYLGEISEADLVEIYNNYCDKRHYDEDKIWYMCEIEMELDAYLQTHSPKELIEEFKDFDFECPWYKWTVYGYEAIEDVYDDIDLRDLIEYIVDNEEDFGDNGIRIIIDRWDEEDEEEE